MSVMVSRLRVFARRCTGVVLLLALAACTRDAGQVVFHAEGNPPALSDWRLLHVGDGALQLNEGVVPYDLNTPLFSDYAHKLRTVWLPPGTAAKYAADGALDFPVGTIISKTFWYPLPAGAAAGGKVVLANDTHTPALTNGALPLRDVRLVETRLLVRRAAGWIALPYVWNAEQTEAVLARAGDELPLQLAREDGRREDFTYVVPNSNQCAGCHATDNKARVLEPIGPKARHLNRDFTYAEGTENQLAHLARIGYLVGAPAADAAPRNADWQDPARSIEHRARAYLDINCGHCHNPKGPGNTSGLALDAATVDPIRLGVCKPPVAAGQGTGDHQFGIVPGKPDESILAYRIASTDPGAMMPELGRGTRHEAGLALVERWIAAMPGTCTLQ